MAEDFWGGAGQDVPAPRRGGGGQRPGPQRPANDYYSGGGGTQGMGNYGTDPFGYTNGSILTPWTQQFDAPPGSGGGYSPPEFQAFQYGDFDYGYKQPEGFAERYNTPDQFWHPDYVAPDAFKAPTEADMKKDPGYAARMKSGQDAITASKAMQGVLKTGGTGKAFLKAGQDYASNEYEKVYGRRAGEHDRAYGESQQTYGTNLGNRTGIYDRNTAAGAQGYQLRQGAWKDNADVSLRGQELGYNVATGKWDRNYAKARQGYDDEQAARQAAASAAASNASQSYNRALDEYKMNYDIFQNNQNNQFSRLLTLGQVGMGAADRQAGYGSEYGGNATSIYGQQANANAAGRVASGNAWQQGLGNIGQGVMDMAMYSDMNRSGGGGRRPAPAPNVPRMQAGGPMASLPGSYVPGPNVPTMYSGVPRPSNPWG